jgi:hypothetical protein
MGKPGEAEKSLAALEKDNPELYSDLLRRLRDYYFSKYSDALAAGRKDGMAANGDLYIRIAERFLAAFKENMGAADYIRMASYYFDGRRYREAAPLLQTARAALQAKIKEGSFETPEQKKAAADSLEAVEERLAACYFDDDPKAAAEAYKTLEKGREAQLRSEYRTDAEYRQAAAEDGRLLYYGMQRAICDIRIEKDSARPVPDFDTLSKAVSTLSDSLARQRPNSTAWWTVQYWLLYGMYLQRDKDNALRFIANLEASTGGFSEESGALAAGPEGKTFKQLIAELKEKISRL